MTSRTGLDVVGGSFAFAPQTTLERCSLSQFEGVDISTDGQLGPEETRWVFLPKTPEWFSHDLDGNLLTDGKWIYTWDGENRLISMETSTALPTAMPPVRLEFVYDYMSRRCVKRLYDRTSNSVTVGNDAIVEGSFAAVVRVVQVDDQPVASGSTNSGDGWAASGVVESEAVAAEA